MRLIALLLLAIYGTLKKGYANHSYLESTERIFAGFTEIPFLMFSNGLFPWLTPAEEPHSIHVEVYRVSKAKLREIDKLERMYQRKKVMIEEIDSKAYIYVLDDRSKGKKIAEGRF